MSTKSWQDVLLEVVEADPADFTDRKNICISPKDLGEILRAALQERDTEIERLKDLEDLAVRRANTATQKLAAQRKVLDQAMEALNSLFSWEVDEQRGKRCTDAITAIQEVLK